MGFKLPGRSRNRFNSVSEFRVGRKLGFGAFAEVFEVTSLASGEVFALKKVRVGELEDCDQRIVQNELEILSSIRSEAIVNLEDFFLEGGLLFLVLELAPGGSLFSLMYEGGELTESRVARVFRDSVLAIREVHNLGILYRDLKPENLLLDRLGKVRVCDFGWACRREDHEFLSAPAGTLAYMPPEALRGEPQDEKCDVWGLGVLLYELHFAREPFPAPDEETLHREILSRPVSFGSPKFKLSLATEQIIRRMLNPERTLRASMKEVVDFVLGSQPPLSSFASSPALYSAKKQEASPVPMRRSEQAVSDHLRSPHRSVHTANSSANNFFAFASPVKSTLVETTSAFDLDKVGSQNKAQHHQHLSQTYSKAQSQSQHQAQPHNQYRPQPQYHPQAHNQESNQSHNRSLSQSKSLPQFYVQPQAQLQVHPQPYAKPPAQPLSSDPQKQSSPAATPPSPFEAGHLGAVFLEKIKSRSGSQLPAQGLPAQSRAETGHVRPTVKLYRPHKENSAAPEPKLARDSHGSHVQSPAKVSEEVISYNATFFTPRKEEPQPQNSINSASESKIRGVSLSLTPYSRRPHEKTSNVFYAPSNGHHVLGWTHNQGQINPNSQINSQNRTQLHSQTYSHSNAQNQAQIQTPPSKIIRSASIQSLQAPQFIQRNQFVGYPPAAKLHLPLPPQHQPQMLRRSYSVTHAPKLQQSVSHQNLDFSRQRDPPGLITLKPSLPNIFGRETQPQRVALNAK